MKKSESEKQSKSLNKLKSLKLTKSIFVKIGLIMLMLLLVLEGVVLALSYGIIYDRNLLEGERDIRRAATLAVEMCEGIDLYHPAKDDNTEEVLSQLCEMFNITYLFAVSPDIETNSETYLAIGFGKEALQEVKDTRYRGVCVEGKLNDKQIEAYNGNTDGIILHEVNTFEDSMVCYMPCTRYLDMNSHDYVYYDKPVVIGAEITLNNVNKTAQNRFRYLALLTASMTLLIAVSFGIILYFRVSKPIRKISNQMSSFVTDRENNKNVEKLKFRGNNELSLMADSFNIMTEDIDRYIGDIDALYREKHRTEAELNIARDIQMGLLLPGHLQSDRYAINAYVNPAKDVGGDYYDYCVMDDGKIFVAVADVSGKGISASLFMARAITLLHQNAIGGYRPSQILEIFNNTLVPRNSEGLFITTFVVVYDPSTGILTYSNAGHNIPYLLSDTLIPLDQAHGVAAGLFEGETYEDATMMIKPGDSLFLYTDGVNEAKNTSDAFYTTERLEKKLSACIALHSADTLEVILNDLFSFTQDAEQNDDITILTLQTKQSPDETILKMTSEVEQLVKVKEGIFGLPIGDDLKRTIYLAAEEIFVNICSYAYDMPGDVIMRLYQEQNRVELTFIDSGKPFDPTRDVLDINEYDHDHMIGGLGRYLAFSIAESYRYEYIDEKNVLQLIFSEGGQDDDHKTT